MKMHIHLINRLSLILVISILGLSISPMQSLALKKTQPISTYNNFFEEYLSERLRVSIDASGGILLPLSQLSVIKLGVDA